MKLYATSQSAIMRSQPEAKVIPVIVPWGIDTRNFRLCGVIGYGMLPMLIDLCILF